MTRSSDSAYNNDNTGLFVPRSGLWRMKTLRVLAEGVGFEPTIRFPVYTLSKRAPSATRPSLRGRGGQYSQGRPADNAGVRVNCRWLRFPPPRGRVTIVARCPLWHRLRQFQFQGPWRRAGH